MGRQISFIFHSYTYYRDIKILSLQYSDAGSAAVYRFVLNPAKTSITIAVIVTRFWAHIDDYDDLIYIEICIYYKCYEIFISHKSELLRDFV